MFEALDKNGVSSVKCGIFIRWKKSADNIWIQNLTWNEVHFEEPELARLKI